MARVEEAEAIVAEYKGIFGIGPAFAKKLKEAGVGLPELAEANDDDLDRWDVKLALRGAPREHDWRQQAIDILAKEPTKALLTEVVGSMALKSGSTDQLAEANAAIKALQAKLAAAGVTDMEPARSGRRPRRLDRNKKFSEVYGRDVDHDGAGFMQMRDGEAVYFDHAGVETGEGVNGTPEPERKAVDIDDVHFLNWLDKKVNYPFDLLRRAIKARWPNSHRALDSEKKAYAFLHAQLRANA